MKALIVVLVARVVFLVLVVHVVLVVLVVLVVCAVLVDQDKEKGKQKEKDKGKQKKKYKGFNTRYDSFGKGLQARLFARQHNVNIFVTQIVSLENVAGVQILLKEFLAQ